MKLLRLGEPGHERPGALHGDRVVDVSARFPDYDAACFASDAAFFASGGLALLAGLGVAGFTGLPEAARRQPLPGAGSPSRRAVVKASARR